MDVTINDEQISIASEIETWGELLDWIETDHLKPGQWITHVYFAGNETCNYRDRLVCDQDLKAIGNVDIRCGDFDEVVHESLAELERELRNALVASQEIVRLLENRQEEEAYNRLAQLLE